MAYSDYSGTFLSFEGIDGAGKSTQIQLLVAYLEEQGYDVVSTREPGGTPLGEQIRALLLDKTYHQMHVYTELLLVVAARVQHVYEVILPALQRGAIVISDRFSDATRAYQGYAGKLKLSLIEDLMKVGGCTLEPDRTFVLDITVEKSEQRRRNERDRFENKGESYLDQVRQGYIDLVNNNPDRMRLIVADADPQSIFAQVKECVHEVFCYLG